MGQCQSRNEKRRLVPSSSSGALQVLQSEPDLKSVSHGSALDTQSGRGREKNSVNESTNSLNLSRKLSTAPSKPRKHSSESKGSKKWSMKGKDGTNTEDLSTQVSQRHYMASENDLEWMKLYLKQVGKIIDPSDFITVVDERVASITNGLNPSELLRIQRHTRSILREFKGGNNSTKSLYWKDNRRLLDEPVFRRIFSSGDTLLKDINAKRREDEEKHAEAEKEYFSDNEKSSKKRDKKEKSGSKFFKLSQNHNSHHHNVNYDDNDIISEKPDLIGSAFILLAYMSSENVLEAVSALAESSFIASGLDMDLHLYASDAVDDSGNMDIPVPLLKRLFSLSSKSNSLGPELPLGLSYAALCAFMAMALKGTRNQRICLLFHLFLPPKVLKSLLHTRGQFPTWLLEIDAELILSIYSLCYFYYIPEQGNSTSLPPMKISALSAFEIITCLTSDVETSTNNKTANTKAEYPLYDNEKQDTTNKKQATNNELSEETDITVSNDKPTETAHHDQAAAQPLDAFESYNPTSNVTWTYIDFVSWANYYLTDTKLDALFFKLFGVDILFSPSNELKSAQKRWESWEKTDLKYWKKVCSSGDTSDNLIKSGRTIDIRNVDENVDGDKSSSFFAKLFYGGSYALSGSTSNIANVDNLNEEKVTTTNSLVKENEVFGGIGGIDGKGGLGFGIMYCVDKYWWEEWKQYSGWQYAAETYDSSNSSERRVRKRPGEISNERLLQRHDSVSGVVRGTLGSYEIIDQRYRKDVDFVLIPPSVWDLLYELYGGGPPLPRMVFSPKDNKEESLKEQSSNEKVKIFCNIDRTTSDCSTFSKNNGKDACNQISPCGTLENVEVVSKEGNNEHSFGLEARTYKEFLPQHVPRSMQVSVHPWIINCQMCDPHQPYRRGDVGTLSIHIMTGPDQPLWRFFAEIVMRLPVHHPKGRDSKGRGKARLWKRDSVTNTQNGKDDASLINSASSRYGPWSLLCKNRFAFIPISVQSDNRNSFSDNAYSSFRDFVSDWETYTDNATVDSAGLCDGMRVMLEHALVSKHGVYSWPREAAAKAGRAKRIVDEDTAFRRWLRGVDANGSLCKSSLPLVGATIDAMDTSGRWYQACIAQVNNKMLRQNEMQDDLASIDEENTSTLHSANDSPQAFVSGENRRILVDFSDVGGGEEWIATDSDRLACAGRFTSDSLKTLDIESDDVSVASSAADSKLKLPTSNRKLVSSNDNSSVSTEMTSSSGTGICPFPGFGACGLSNLGNTCYANAALQCIGYMPLLRCYLLSGLYRADINRDNPLGTGGKLLEEYADLLRLLWSGKFSYRAPTKFRSQLAKARSQFSANDQQDAQELLNAMLDALHEDSSKIKKKKLVPPLDDAWVQKNILPRVGLEAWRRYLRRNRSIIAHTGMGQVLNRVTCPVCNHTSFNFDPFSMLSLPFPTIAEVNFRCILIRRATAINCPRILARKKKENYSSDDVSNDSKSINSNISFESQTVDATPPSEQFIFEEYIIAMSRLADISDLKVRLQNYSGIPVNRLKLAKSEEVVINQDLPKHNPLRTCVNVSALPENLGPCSQLAKLPVTCDNDTSPVTAPVLLLAFESTLRPRPPLISEEDETDSTDEDVTSSQEGDALSTIDESKQLGLNGENGSQKSLSSFNKRLELQLQLYGDYQECSLYDTDPTPISKAMSRILWPKTSADFKLGLRVDAIDHRNHWYPGTVVEIIETEEQSKKWNDKNDDRTSTKVRIHFDNFSSRWDEVYGIEQFQQDQVRPLYSHATPRVKPLEFLVHHRHGINPRKSTNSNSNGISSVSLFGQSFFLQCHGEWSTARAGAHILAQASRFIQSKIAHTDKDVTSRGGNDDEEVPHDESNTDENSSVYKAFQEARSVIGEIIRVLVDIDRKYVKCARSSGRLSNEQRRSRNPNSFNATAMTMSLSKKLSTLLPRLPFEVRVCAADSPLGGYGITPSEEVTFPFSLVRTIGNYMNARLAIVLHWHGLFPEASSTKGRLKSVAIMPNTGESTDGFVLYSQPPLHVHKETHILLAESASEDSDNHDTLNGTHRVLRSATMRRKKTPVHGGMHLGVCLTEFCKEQQLPEGWKCPKCKVDREGKQSMNLWRLPDLLIFHIKRFNCSARWREKISTKVNFPLTGLDLGQWCDHESPALSDTNESTVYDLIAVINHLGGMTGGHYVATCKATQCGTDGIEEVAHSFNGYGVSCYSAEEETVQTGWRLGRSKERENASAQSRAALANSRSLSRSSEPLWLQFDDDLVEPIPPRAVVSEMAYVLFYRRRKLTPSNIARYSTPD